VIAVSNLVKRDLVQYHRVPLHRIYVVPNAIDPRRLEVSQPGALRCAFRNRLGIEPGELVGFFAGHNLALKGLKPLLEALGERRRRNRAGRPIHLLVCGGGETASYKRLSRRHGLAGMVHFLGFYRQVEDCYWSSDFFVQPTYYDPCSLVVMEALACGLPVITTAKNGASEMMESGREGFVLSEPAARGELLSALEQMADDKARCAMSAKASALGRYQTFDVHVARLIAIFEEVAAAKSRRAPHSRVQKAHQNTPHFARSRKSWH
jgi:UDP-glucose:(heptosyl)LPS alpha-1,3-glucosyltransferase